MECNILTACTAQTCTGVLHYISDLKLSSESEEAKFFIRQYIGIPGGWWSSGLAEDAWQVEDFPTPHFCAGMNSGTTSSWTEEAALIFNVLSRVEH
jgi:hypothetical protein